MAWLKMVQSYTQCKIRSKDLQTITNVLYGALQLLDGTSPGGSHSIKTDKYGLSSVCNLVVLTSVFSMVPRQTSNYRGLS